MVIHPSHVHANSYPHRGTGREGKGGEGVDGTVIVKHSLAASIDGWTMGRGVGAERGSA